MGIKMKDDFIVIDLSWVLSKWGLHAVELLDDFYEKTNLSSNVVSSSELAHCVVNHIMKVLNERYETSWKLEYIHSSGNCTRICDNQHTQFKKWLLHIEETIFRMDYTSLIFLYAEAASLKWNAAANLAYYFQSKVEETREENSEAKTLIVDLAHMLKLLEGESTLRVNKSSN